MPTQTFFRLPEEKRLRLTEAGWREFASVNYADVSINRIVQEANVPRGSFYQYFEDKADFFFYLLGTCREEGIGMMRDALERARGDPFAVIPDVFDQVFREDGTVRPPLERVITVLRQNHDMDVSRMLEEQVSRDPDVLELNRRTDWTVLRDKSEGYAHEVGMLLLFSFACAMKNILEDPACLRQERERLMTRLDIIRRGCEREESAT